MGKVYCIPILGWKITFLIIQLATLALLIGSMASDYWFYQKWKYDSIDKKVTVRGRLLVTITDYTFCEYGSSFKYCHDECRDDCNDYQKCLDTCDRFKYWHEAGVAYLLCDLGAGLFLLLSIIITIFSFFKLGRSRICINLIASTFFTVLSFLSHILAFSVYVGKIEMNTDDCTHDSDYSGQKSVCMRSGAFIAISIMVWFFILIPVKFFISRKVYVEEKNEERTLMG
jgi:hypothetical protein